MWGRVVRHCVLVFVYVCVCVRARARVRTLAYRDIGITNLSLIYNYTNTRCQYLDSKNHKHNNAIKSPPLLKTHCHVTSWTRTKNGLRNVQENVKLKLIYITVNKTSSKPHPTLLKYFRFGQHKSYLKTCLQSMSIKQVYKKVYKTCLQNMPFSFHICITDDSTCHLPDLSLSLSLSLCVCVRERECVCV